VTLQRSASSRPTHGLRYLIGGVTIVPSRLGVGRAVVMKMTGTDGRDRVHHSRLTLAMTTAMG
jgi:hypothetical protein